MTKQIRYSPEVRERAVQCGSRVGFVEVLKVI